MGKYAVELNAVPNPKCRRCSREERDDYQDDDLCQEACSVEDGLPVRCVGKWAYEKTYRLVQYFGIFARGMKRKWSGKLNYVEICCGPGRCVLRETGEEVDGTALAIAKHPAFTLLNNAVFVDYDPRTLDVLDQRLARVDRGRTRVRVVPGDFTEQEQLRVILAGLPPRHLNLVFIDPTECNLPFSTVELITDTLRSVDLIVNVADDV